MRTRSVTLRIEQSEYPKSDDHNFTMNLVVDRACPDHREVLIEEKCPRGCVCADDSDPGPDAVGNPLAWLVVEIVNGRVGRTIAWVYREGVEWAQWFEHADLDNESPEVA